MKPTALAENFRSFAALGRFVLTALIGLSVDLWSKAAAFEALASYSDGGLSSETHRLIPGFLHLVVTVNAGAVFGLGQGQRELFLTVSIAAIAFLTYLFAASGRQRFYQVILGMLLAGVLGNMYDRVRFGHVRDMIQALPGWQWPGTWTIPLIQYPGPERMVFPWIFNIADVLLCTGVGLMLLYSVLHSRQRAAPATEPPGTAA